MEYIKQNNGWDAEPNAPTPRIEIKDATSKLILSFYTNAFIHDDVDENDIGVIEFNNCFKYRIGPTNDEGFYRGQCRFSNTDIKWGDFYQIIDSNWRNDFPDDEIIINNSLKDDQDLCHYLFYFRDNTFECISKSYCFFIERDNKSNGL